MLGSLVLKLNGVLIRKQAIINQASLIFAWIFPCILMSVAYAVEGGDAGFENEVLNAARYVLCFERL